MKQKIQITVFDKEQYDDGDWPPANFPKCVEWFAEKLESIPAEYRVSSQIEIGSEGGYEGSHYSHISITYWRTETNAEEKKREGEEAARRDNTKRRELMELQRLQSKYNGAFESTQP